MGKFANGIVAPLLAGIIAFAITAYGQGLWGLLVIANIKFHPELPWAAPTMAVLLVLLLLYLGGLGPPRSNSGTRRRLLRWNTMPLSTFFFALLTGALALVAMGGAWIVMSDLIHLPPNITPSVKGYPLVTVISILVMATLAAPLSEEAAFRGYAQGILERAWGWAPAAILGSSVLFALAHFTQGFSLPKLSLYFYAGLIFGTIAYLTNSLYAAMVVHSMGDYLGFLVLWPHDAHWHKLVTEGGSDALFVPAVTSFVVFLPLSVFAFVRLARMRHIPTAVAP
jgi:membrane protease YdiL (CAAX protease family)